MLPRGNLDVDQCKKPSLKHKGRIVAMSTRALKVLPPQQAATLERSATILPLEVPTVEPAAGSVRKPSRRAQSRACKRPH